MLTVSPLLLYFLLKRDTIPVDYVSTYLYYYQSLPPLLFLSDLAFWPYLYLTIYISLGLPRTSSWGSRLIRYIMTHARWQASREVD